MREYRGMLGWSQEKLAQVAGVHWSYLGELERGCRNPTLLTIERVADALGVSAAQLVSDG
ncbi:MAG: helix-turn-helix transcriptional regulator [Actinobacteria bacterium]|nr:helix-turn-helix transcriptional regulator [Actinomycetota bacterium]